MLNYRKVRIFVASPCDVKKEREALGKVILSLNQVFSDSFRLILELKEWRQVVPDMGLPQEVILNQLDIKTWDIFVGVLWLRFGMQTGAINKFNGHSFDSGTEQEFTLAYRLWLQIQRPRILFYRCLRLPPRLLDIDAEQFTKVSKFFSGFAPGEQKPGLFSEYEDVEDFKDLVREHLETLLYNDQEHIPSHSSFGAATSTVSTSQKNPLGSQQFKNPFIIGRPILDSDDFFGRCSEIGFALARLRTMQSLSLLGERRIGKTSMLHYILYLAREQLGASVRTCYIDMMGSGARTPDALLRKIQVELGLDDQVDTLTKFSEALENIHRSGIQPILAMDEIEIIIRLPQDFALDFFEALRALASAGELVLLTASRISLRQLHDSGTLVSPLYNIMGTLKLGRFTEEESREFVTFHRDKIHFTDDQVNTILKLAKRHPLHLQMLCFHIAQANHDKRVNMADVIAAAEAEAHDMLNTRTTLNLDQ